MMKRILLVLVWASVQSNFFAMSPSGMPTNPTQETPWTLPSNQITPTLFYQGMFCSQTQCAKYTGTHGFTSTTGEHVECSKGIDVIHTPYIGVELEEVRPQVPFSELWKNRINPLNLIKALYYYTHYVVSQRQNKAFGITVTPTTTSQPSHQTIAGHSINVGQITIGQAADVKTHQSKYDKLINEYAESPIIIYGVSRGAATSFSAVAMNKYFNIRLAILEGCFDSHEHLMTERLPKSSSLGVQKLIVPILEKITSYKRDGINPIDNVSLFPQNVPVLFVTSAIDTEVPAACTKKLAQALVQNGHKDVYLLELKKSAHPRYMMDDQQDAELYEQVTHALYQKLQLPHKPMLAEKGKAALEQCHLNPSK